MPWKKCPWGTERDIKSNFHKKIITNHKKMKKIIFTLIAFLITLQYSFACDSFIWDWSDCGWIIIEESNKDLIQTFFYIILALYIW